MGVVVVVKAQVVEWAVDTEGGGHYRQEEEDGGGRGVRHCSITVMSEALTTLVCAG